MTEAPEWVRVGFVRQRRNLLAVSVALIAFQEIGAEFKKLNVLGNDIDLARPLNIAVPLWVLWVYFLTRYYQYFRDLNDIGFFDAFRLRREHLMKRVAAMKLRREHVKPDLAGFIDPVWIVNVEDIRPLGNTSGLPTFAARGHMAIADRRARKRAIQYFNEVEILLDMNEPRFVDIRASVWVMFNTHRGTEYVLPFAVAVLPVFVALPALWRASLALIGAS